MTITSDTSTDGNAGTSRSIHTALHPSLVQLLADMGRDGTAVDSGPLWVVFLSDDAQIHAFVKEGETRLCVHAYLLDSEGEPPSTDEVAAWSARQPRPATGILEVFVHEDEAGKAIPRLVFERFLGPVDAEPILEDIFQFAEAWEARSIATPAQVEGFELDNPAGSPPRSAWLLIGSESSYPTPEWLADGVAEGAVGIYDTEWTAPRNGELGDLALIYFMAPRKAACFVARMASRSFWRTDTEVAADKNVDDHQWWVYLTPPIEIEPIPYQALRAAHDDFLILKGTTGHYLRPETIAALTFTAKNPEQQLLVDQVVEAPTGKTELPATGTISFEEWTQIPSALLDLEAHVSEYIVKPLWRHLFFSRAKVPPTLVREHRIRAGSVDFTARCPDHGRTTAIEVKRAIKRPATGVWADSPDFRQLRRYMTDLGGDGILIDAASILLVRHGADAPFAEINRATATPDNLRTIRELIESCCDGDWMLAPGTYEEELLEGWKNANVTHDQAAKDVNEIFDELVMLLYRAPYRHGDEQLQPTLGPMQMSEDRAGVPCIILEYAFNPALAVELTETIGVPTAWAEWSVFQNLQRSMDHLNIPGLIIDLERVLLVRPGADAPYAEIVRADATWDDVRMIRAVLLEAPLRNTLLPKVERQEVRAAARRVARRG